MFIIYVSGMLNAASCVDWINNQGYEFIRAINNDGDWSIQFKFIDNYGKS